MVVYTNTRSEATKPYPAGKVWMGVVQSGESPLPDKKGSVTMVYTNTRSEATKPYPAGKVWMGGCAKRSVTSSRQKRLRHGGLHEYPERSD